MGRFVANPFLWIFADAARPSLWKSRQARCIYAEALDAEAKGEDLPHAVRGSVRAICAPDPARPEISRYGTPPAYAAEKVQRHIQELRRQADAMERELAAYGPGYFTVAPVPMHAPSHPFDAEAAILALLRTPRLEKLLIHGRTFSRDESGAFRLERE